MEKNRPPFFIFLIKAEPQSKKNSEFFLSKAAPFLPAVIYIFVAGPIPEYPKPKLQEDKTDPKRVWGDYSYC